MKEPNLFKLTRKISIEKDNFQHTHNIADFFSKHNLDHKICKDNSLMEKRQTSRDL